MDSFDSAALRAVEHFSMLARGDAVTVGLSGGADSVALLSFLHRHADEFGIELRAAHLNHSLRGKESLRDERFVRRLCAAWGVPLEVRSVDIAALARERRCSVEECAREERYAFFAAVRRGGRVATAHTATDNLETILLNLARGTSLAGLCGIPPVRGYIIRPLLFCSRAMVEAECKSRKLTFVTDSTNLTDEYSRGRIRRHVLPVLRELNPRLEENASEMSLLLREDADYLDNIAASALEAISSPTLPGLDRAAYLALDRPIASRALIRLLKEAGAAYDRARVARMDACIRAAGAPLQLAPDLRLIVRGDRFWIEHKAAPPSPFAVSVEKSALAEGDVTLSAGKTLRFRRMEYEDFENYYKSSPTHLKNALDYDKIDALVVLRSRRPGDSIRLSGRSCTKTLKDLLREERVPASERPLLVILESEGKPAWIEGFGVSEACAPGPGSRTVLLAEAASEGQSCFD